MHKIIPNSKIAFVKAYITPFSGTSANDIFHEHVRELSGEEMYQYSSPAFNVNAVTDNELKGAQGLLYKQFLLHPSYIVKHLVENVFFYIKIMMCS